MNFISGITSAVALGISIILLFATWGWMQQGKGEKQTHSYLLILLVIICLQLLELIYHSFNLHEQWPVFIKLVDPLVVMAPLLFFAYIKGLKGQTVILKGKGLLHLLPGLYVLAWDIAFWFLPAQDKILYMEQGFLVDFPWTVFVLYRSDYLALLAGLIIFYWWQIKALIGTKFGPASRLDEFIQRLRQAMLLLATGMVICALTGYGSGTNLILSIGVSILVGYLCYFFLQQAKMPKAFGIEKPSRTPTETIILITAEGTANELVEFDLSDTLLAFQALELQLKSGLFQVNGLSLAKLAEVGGLNVHLASKAINEYSGGNFYDWVNHYRVEKAKLLLLQSDQQISRICYDVGFNSKSTFYAAFKKTTGITPGAFRKHYEYTS